MNQPAFLQSVNSSKHAELYAPAGKGHAEEEGFRVVSTTRVSAFEPTGSWTVVFSINK